jgi:hypothetical protein
MTDLRHLSAFLCAPAARRRALLAIVVAMFAAFFGTFLTCFGTNGAYFSSKLTFHAHELNSGLARRSAFHIVLYTLPHHGHVFLLQAC